MSELKFRIWDKQYKHWLMNSCSLHCFSNWTICPFTGKLIDYVGAIDGDHGDSYTASPAPNYYTLNGELIKESRYVIQQWSGMKDRNGKKVYIGDIVAEKFSPELAANGVSAIVGDVYFVAGTFMIDGDGPLYDHTFSASPDILEAFYVIGNKFENPELLRTPNRIR